MDQEGCVFDILMKKDSFVFEQDMYLAVFRPFVDKECAVSLEHRCVEDLPRPVYKKLSTAVR